MTAASHNSLRACCLRRDGVSRIAEKNHRARSGDVTATHAAHFPKVRLVTIDGQFGGWQKEQKTHFADSRTFGQIYAGGK
jgi:sulfate/thiosulfate transport system substrate-binding protein